MSKIPSYCLYIIDNITSESITAIVDGLHNGLSKRFGKDYSLSVKNIFEDGNGESASKDGVFSVPSLVRTCPPPIEQVVYSEGETARLIVALDPEEDDSSTL